MQDYNTIIGVITMRRNECSYSVIQSRYHIGSSTLQLIMKRFGESGLSLDQLKELTPEELEQIFYPPEKLRRKKLPLPDFQLY